MLSVGKGGGVEGDEDGMRLCLFREDAMGTDAVGEKLMGRGRTGDEGAMCSVPAMLALRLFGSMPPRPGIDEGEDEGFSCCLAFALDPLAALALVRLRFLMTSVLRLRGRTTPCSLRKRPHALQRGWPCGLRRQSGVVVV